MAGSGGEGELPVSTVYDGGGGEWVAVEVPVFMG